MSTPLLSAVVPVYRSAATLPELCERLSKSLASISDDFEVIFVEDAGGDDAWDVITKLAQSDSRVKGVQLSRNFGQHAATICGISKANGEWIVTIDDDLEQAPEFIPLLYRKAQEGFALVYGVYSQRTHATWRNLTSEVGRRMLRAAIPNLNYDYTSFRVIQRHTAMALIGFDSPFPFVDGYLSWVTNRYATVPVEHNSRKHSRSNYNFRKLVAHMINIFVTFSDLPLKFATWAGLGAFLAGVLWLVTIVLRRVLGGISVSGYASIMAGIIAFGGLQLLILGILGEYLGRIFEEAKGRPLYLVAATINMNQRGDQQPTAQNARDMTVPMDLGSAR